MDDFKLALMANRLSTTKKLPLDELDDYAIELNYTFYSFILIDLLFARIAASGFTRTEAMNRFMRNHIDLQKLY